MSWLLRRGQIAGRGALDASGGAPATATWTTGVGTLVYSDANLTVTLPGGGGNECLRATLSHSTGKYYYEMIPVVKGGNMCPGIGNASHGLTTFLGSNTASCSWLGATGGCYVNNAAVFIQTYAQGDTLCCATDLDNMKIWFRTNGGNWNNDVIGNQNPATNTGGRDISGLAGGPYFPMAMLSNSLDKMTANFGGSAYAQTPPAGFGNW